MISEYSIIEKLSRSSYLVEKQGVKYIIKEAIEPVSKSGRLFRFIFNTNIKFLNEQRVNTILREEKFTYVRIPKMIGKSERSIVFELVEGKQGFSFDTVDESYASNALIEYQTKINNYTNYTLKDKILLYLLKPNIVFLRRLFTYSFRNIELSLLLKGLSCLFRMSFFKKQKRALLIHNDLLPNNIMTDNSNRLIFLDFENSIYENKWILTDIVDFAYDPLIQKFNINYFKNYLSKLAELGFALNDSYIFIQVKVLLIKRLIQVLTSNKFNSKLKELNKKYLFEVLLNSKSFEDILNKEVFI